MGRRKSWRSRTSTRLHTHKMAADTLLWALTKPPIEQHFHVALSEETLWHSSILSKFSSTQIPHTTFSYMSVWLWSGFSCILLIFESKCWSKLFRKQVFEITDRIQVIKMTGHSRGQLIFTTPWVQTLWATALASSFLLRHLGDPAQAIQPGHNTWQEVELLTDYLTSQSEA